MCVVRKEKVDVRGMELELELVKMKKLISQVEGPSFEFRHKAAAGPELPSFVWSREHAPSSSTSSSTFHLNFNSNFILTLPLPPLNNDILIMRLRQCEDGLIYAHCCPTHAEDRLDCCSRRHSDSRFDSSVLSPMRLPV